MIEVRFFELVAQFAKSADDEENPAAAMTKLLDEQGQKAFASEIMAIDRERDSV